MSEHHKRHHESHHGHEQAVSHEHQAEVEKHIHEKAQEARKKAHEQDIEALRESVAESSQESRKVAVEQPDKAPSHGYGAHHLLKADAYRRTLQRVRRQLPRSARAFSTFIHQSTIESISEMSAKTVARPSGLLGGSIGAFVGSAVLLYATKHYGFRYNYSLFLLLFIGGFAAGLVLELLVWLAWRRRHS